MTLQRGLEGAAYPALVALSVAIALLITRVMDPWHPDPTAMQSPLAPAGAGTAVVLECTYSGRR